MNKLLSLVILAALVLTYVSSSAQDSMVEAEFDCGTIAPNGSGAMAYEDFSHGFRFEFPGDWKGGEMFLHGPGTAAQIMVAALTASSDPKFYATEPAKPTGSETINGLTWTALTWQNGGRSYYTYSHGVAIEAFAAAFGNNKAAANLTAFSYLIVTDTVMLTSDRNYT